VATDDPDRCRFAKVGEGFDKWLKRQAIPGGLTAIWVRERLSGGSAEVVHCHMLFHLAHPFLAGQKRIQVETALERLTTGTVEATGATSHSSSPFLAIRTGSIC
jgi:hypothetical protein